MLAERIGVSASTASESIRKLADQGLVDHEKYGAVTLTEAGRAAALAMVRRHRLMETFLVRELGYSWDEVHDEAEVLEHAVSDRMLDRIDAKLGHPTRDPHGDPIPAADGQVPTPDARQLSVCQDGDTGTVARISDSDPEMLRYFDSVGISLDSRLLVLARRDFAGMISVAVKSADAGEHEPGTTVDLGSPAAEAIWVVRLAGLVQPRRGRRARRRSRSSIRPDCSVEPLARKMPNRLDTTSSARTSARRLPSVTPACRSSSDGGHDARARRRGFHRARLEDRPQRLGHAPLGRDEIRIPVHPPSQRLRWRMCSNSSAAEHETSASSVR